LASAQAAWAFDPELFVAIPDTVKLQVEEWGVMGYI